MRKNFGGAYLFEFMYTYPDIVFLDDFEHEMWDENGWHSLTKGNGFGEVAVIEGIGYSDTSLTIRACMVPTILECWYANGIRREIFVQNNKNVTLSFYLNATEGYNSSDTFAVLVSNIHQNEFIAITNRQGVYEGYANSIWLDEAEGFFEYDLSEAWHQMFNSSLPNPFILEFMNYDFDGVCNTALLDNITITCT
jgi:hypothetical protein